MYDDAIKVGWGNTRFFFETNLKSFKVTYSVSSLLTEFTSSRGLPRRETWLLCHYIITSIQSLCNDPITVDYLAKHLGHSVSVHETYYREQLMCMERGKIPLLLNATNEGRLSSDHHCVIRGTMRKVLREKDEKEDIDVQTEVECQEESVIEGA